MVALTGHSHGSATPPDLPGGNPEPRFAETFIPLIEFPRRDHFQNVVTDMEREFDSSEPSINKRQQETLQRKLSI
jgi:hypothetical protein